MAKDVFRSGQIITANKTGVNSDCNQIIIQNEGDEVVTVTLQDTRLSFTLQAKTSTKTDYLIFGALSSELFERSIFDFSFAGGGANPKISVMRANVIDRKESPKPDPLTAAITNLEIVLSKINSKIF